MCSACNDRGEPCLIQSAGDICSIFERDEAPRHRERGRPVRIAPQALNSLLLQLSFALRAQCGRDVRAPSIEVREHQRDLLTIAIGTRPFT